MNKLISIPEKLAVALRGYCYKAKIFHNTFIIEAIAYRLNELADQLESDGLLTTMADYNAECQAEQEAEEKRRIVKQAALEKEFLE